MQKMIFSGNLVKDVEKREMPNGKFVANFSVAVKRPHNIETTDFFDVCAYDKLGEICAKYLSKGSKALVEGYMTTRTYEDKQGNKKKIYEVKCENIEFLSNNSNGNQKQEDVLPF